MFFKNMYGFMDDTIVAIIIIYKKTPILNVNPISRLYTMNKNTILSIQL
jgi:hypothetical protein